MKNKQKTIIQKKGPWVCRNCGEPIHKFRGRPLYSCPVCNTTGKYLIEKKLNKQGIMKRAHELFGNNESGWTFADAMHVAWLEAKGIEEGW